MEDDALTRVRLNTPSLVGLVASVAFLSFVGWIALFGASGSGSLVIVCGAFALLGIGANVWRMYTAPCPGCGTPYVGGVRPTNNASMQCKSCQAYFHTAGGRSMATADDAIEARPAFEAPCPTRAIVWPSGCCVCGGAATRAASIEIDVTSDAPLAQDLAMRAATLGTFRLVREHHYAVSVPVCDAHSEGSARLTFHDQQLFVAFRSRRYAKRFEEANGLRYLDA